MPLFTCSCWPLQFRERQTYFYQAVILLLDHGPEGSYGIILNRPTQYKVSQIKSSVHSLLSLFPENRLFMGGDCGDTAMVVLTHRCAASNPSLLGVPSMQAFGLHSLWQLLHGSILLLYELCS